MGDRVEVEAILALLVVTNLVLLGSSRLWSCIRIVAIQGSVVGLLPILLQGHDGAGRAWGLALVTIALKGIIFPWRLLRILRDTSARREVEPFVGYTPSLLAGVSALVFSMWVSTQMALPRPAGGTPLAIPVGLSMLLTGLFVILSRRKAVTQVLGYIVMENGIYTFGVAMVVGVPMLVELGVLLDAFVAVFIMSIAAYHISREFDHIDVDQLNRLKG